MVLEMFKTNRSRSSTALENSDSFDVFDYPSSGSDNPLPSQDDIFDSTVSLYRVSQFELWFLGMVQELNLGGVNKRDPDILLIDKLEESQLEGKVELLPKKDDLVTVTVSKHGVKVMDYHRKEVLQRHPLHTVGQVVSYSDSFGKSNVALTIGQVGRTVFDCYVFQCYSEDQAENFCESLKDVFDVITSHSS